MKYFLLIPGLIGLVIIVVALIWVLKRKNTSSSGSGNQNPPATPAAHAAGGHGHHHNAGAIESLQALSGGLIIWQDWGLKSCFTALFMFVLCLMALTSGFHSVALKIWWGLASLMFLIFTVTQVIRVFKSTKDAAGHIHQHYWDKYTESLIATAMWLGFIVVICTGPTSFLYELNRKEEAKIHNRTEVRQLVAKDATASKWTWVHYLPNGMPNGKPNQEVTFLVWNPNEIIIQIPEENGGGNTTLHYRKGDEFWSWRSSNGTAQGWLKTNLTTGGIIPPFEGTTTFGGSIDNWKRDSSGNWQVGIPETSTTGSWSLSKGEVLYEYRKKTY